jgi:hypothetical protein
MFLVLKKRIWEQTRNARQAFTVYQGKRITVASGASLLTVRAHGPTEVPLAHPWHPQGGVRMPKTSPRNSPKLRNTCAKFCPDRPGDHGPGTHVELGQASGQLGEGRC